MNSAELASGPELAGQSLPITLQAGRLRSVVLLLVFGAFTALGVWMGLDTHNWRGWAFTALFSVGLVVFTINLIPGASYLRLGEDGFTYSALYRKHTVKWASTLQFGVVRTRSNKVAWTFVPNHRMSTTTRQLNRALVGFDAALPETYGRDAVVLAVMMATLRDRYWAEHGLLENDIQGEIVPLSDNAAWAGGSSVTRGLKQ